jgi:hypothetical protein
MREGEQALFKLALDQGVKSELERAIGEQDRHDAGTGTRQGRPLAP